MLLTEMSPSWGKIVEKISGITKGFGLAILFLAISVNAVDIIGRVFLHRPLLGSVELLGFIAVLFFAVAFAYTAGNDGHITMDLLTSRFPDRIRPVIRSIMYLVCCAIFNLIAWRIWLFANILRSSGEVSMVLRIPHYPFVCFYALGFSALYLVFIYKFVESIIQIVKERSLLFFFVSILVLIILSGAFSFILVANIDIIPFAVIGIIMLFVLFFLGMPVGAAMILVGFLGFAYGTSVDAGLSLLARDSYDTASSYIIFIIIFLVFITSLVQQSGMVHYISVSLTNLFRSLPGGTALAGVLASLFSAPSVCSSQANVAGVGRAILKENNGIDEKITFPASATGGIAAGGTLGMLVPPSLALVIFAILTEQSIGRLFIAAIIPGLLISLLFLIYVFIKSLTGPQMSFKTKGMSGEEIVTGIIGFIASLFIGLVVLIGIASGLMTPVEASGIAALISFILALICSLLLNRSVFSVLLNAAHQTIYTSGKIILVLIGTVLFGHFLAIARLPFNLASFISGLDVSPLFIFLTIALIYLFISCFIEGFTLFVLSIPMIFGTISALGFDQVWFGVVLILIASIGMLLPPQSGSLRIVKLLDQDHKRKEIVISTLPYVALMIVVLGLLMAFPHIVLWLPSMFFG